MRQRVSDERAVVDGRTLRLAFRTQSPAFACDLKDPQTGASRTVPVLSSGRETHCTFDLRGLPPGIYSLAIRTADGPVPFGGSIAEQRKALAGALGGDPRRVAHSKFTAGQDTVFASLYVDRMAGGLRLRLSASDDIAAFLGAQSGTAPDTKTRFSVVCPVFNVGKYLDAFLSSLTSQTLDFRSHIELIVVDDGSTDDSGEIVRRWQRKFPDNIRYFRKENGGPAAARNYGLAHASHEWVTFPDSDDILDGNYFRAVDDAIRRHRDVPIAMVACNLIVYYEEIDERRDNHYLRFKFANGPAILPAEDLGRNIQFNINSTFVLKRILAEERLQFDVRVKPNFEDSHLIQRYLLRAGGMSVLFLPEARYVYRHRADQSSLVQTAPGRPEWYGDQLEFGYLALLAECEERIGKVPRHVENVILCDLMRQLQAVVDRDDPVPFLDNAARRRFRDLLDRIFARIGADTIYGYDISPMPPMYRAGILGFFKKAPITRPLAICARTDRPRRQIQVIYFTAGPRPTCRFLIDGKRVAPAFHKSIRHDFLGEDFIWEHVDWIPVGRGARLGVEIDGRQARIWLGAGHSIDELPIAHVFSAERPLRDPALPPQVRQIREVARSPKAVGAYRDAWVFMDRDDQADDNAEHLYRYVRRNHPERNAWFVLKPGSPDWKRLAAEGFRLLPFASADHIFALLNAEMLISSQADHYVTDLLDHNFIDMRRYRFVFLQHGVTKDDISDWVNEKPIDLMIACTRPEFESIVGDGSRYRLTKKDVALTGFPRHDALLAASSAGGRTIVVMPTWRSSLTAPATGPGHARGLVPAFEASDFARRWKSFLHSPRLASLATEGEYRVALVVHPHLEAALGFFRPPPSIKVHRLGSGTSIQTVFGDGAAFVTDFSSAAFDMAYIGKPVIYYQFDRDFVFGGGHMAASGYFDYDRDGFGPVLTEEGEVLDALEALLRGTAPDPAYRERAEATFAFRDGRSCGRVYEAIAALAGDSRRQEGEDVSAATGRAPPRPGAVEADAIAATGFHRQLLRSGPVGRVSLPVSAAVSRKGKPRPMHLVIELGVDRQTRDPPFVSCLMLTRNRPELARLAIDCFRRQTWPNRELVMLDTSDRNDLGGLVESLNDPAIRHLFMPELSLPLGAKRNLAAEHARGTHVAVWDDDDLSHPARLEAQIAVLEASKAEANLLSREIMWLPRTDSMAILQRRAHENTLLCTKSAMPRYPEVERGEDTPAIQELMRTKTVSYLDLPELYVYVFHGANTWSSEHMQMRWKASTHRFTGADYDEAFRQVSLAHPLAAYLAILNRSHAEPEPPAPYQVP